MNLRAFRKHLGELGIGDELEAAAHARGTTIYKAFEGGRTPHLVAIRHLVYRTLSERFGWSHGAIADAAGVDTSTVWHALKGKR